MACTRILSLHAQPACDLHPDIDAIVRELKLPGAFPPQVEAAAAQAAHAPRLPELDRTDLELRTIDPPGSMDLDQALHVERSGGGYRVHYAIADVAAFVAAGDAVDIEANARGETLYGGDRRILLYPSVLSEGAASLLPDQVRPALLWTIDLDAAGEIAAIDVRRARVRSRQRCDYAGVQAQVDAGGADAMWGVLREIGELRKAVEQRKGGISLPLPEQEVEDDDGQPRLVFRARHPVEDWNEQISLLTGMAAARLMLDAKLGLLRTLPPPEPWMIERLHRVARSLGFDWPKAVSYPDFIRSLDPAQPRAIAMMTACTTLLRGAGYVAFDGAVPAQTLHWALAAEYAHATAPLRRLCDRYVGEVCVALCAGQPVPDWARAALPGLPATMQAADQRAGRFERAVVDLLEATTLAPHVGETFEGSIVAVDKDRTEGTALLPEHAIEAPVDAATPLPLGERVRMRLVQADPAARKVKFELAG